MGIALKSSFQDLFYCHLDCRPVLAVAIGMLSIAVLLCDQGIASIMLVL